MTKLLRILLIFFIVLVLLFVVFGILKSHQQLSVTTGAVTDNPETVYTIAIDLDGQMDLDKENVLGGRDGLLVIDASLLSNTSAATQAIQQPAAGAANQATNSNTAQSIINSMYVFNGIMSLEQFDTRRDGMISAEDPIYPALEIVIFKGGKITRQLTAFQAGIRAIVFDQEYLKLAIAQDQTRFDKVAATAIMSDGSSRIIKIIPMNLSVFQQAGLPTPNVVPLPTTPPVAPVNP